MKRDGLRSGDGGVGAVQPASRRGFTKVLSICAQIEKNDKTMLERGTTKTYERYERKQTERLKYFDAGVVNEKPHNKLSFGRFNPVLGRFNPRLGSYRPLLTST